MSHTLTTLPSDIAQKQCASRIDFFIHLSSVPRSSKSETYFEQAECQGKERGGDHEEEVGDLLNFKGCGT
jgi:hypothetical protein